MNEIRKEPSPEQLKAMQEQEENERHEQWMQDHPEKITAPSERRECEPEVAEFEAIVASFEAEHSLEELHLITDLTPKEAPNHPLREPAKNALDPIVEKMNVLEKETNISPEKFQELKAQYKRLSQAVGTIKNNKVDHTR